MEGTVEAIADAIADTVVDIVSYDMCMCEGGPKSRDATAVSSEDVSEMTWVQSKRSFVREWTVTPSLRIH